MQLNVPLPYATPSRCCKNQAQLTFVVSFLSTVLPFVYVHSANPGYGLSTDKIDIRYVEIGVFGVERTTGVYFHTRDKCGGIFWPIRKIHGLATSNMDEWPKNPFRTKQKWKRVSTGISISCRTSVSGRNSISRSTDITRPSHARDLSDFGGRSCTS